jgi:hypothetical protein
MQILRKLKLGSQSPFFHSLSSPSPPAFAMRNLIVQKGLILIFWALLNSSMNLGSALTLALSLGRGNKRVSAVSAPFSLGRRVGDEGKSYLHSATPFFDLSQALLTGAIAFRVVTLLWLVATSKDASASRAELRITLL